MATGAAAVNLDLAGQVLGALEGEHRRLEEKFNEYVTLIRESGGVVHPRKILMLFHIYTGLNITGSPGDVGNYAVAFLSAIEVLEQHWMPPDEAVSMIELKSYKEMLQRFHNNPTSAPELYKLLCYTGRFFITFPYTDFMQLRIENMPSKEFYTLFLLYLELYQIPESLFLTYLRGGWVLPDPPLLPPRLPVAYDFVNQIRYSYESVYFQAKVLLRLVFVRKPQQDPELIKVLTWIVQNVDHFGIRPEHLEKFHARTPPGVNFPNELQSLTDGFRFRGPRLGFIYEIVTKDCVGQATEGFQYLFVLIQTYRLTDAKTGADAMMVMFRYLNSIYDKLDTTGTKAELDRGALLR